MQYVPQLLLPTHVPNCEHHVFVLHFLHVEACVWGVGWLGFVCVVSHGVWSGTGVVRRDLNVRRVVYSGKRW